MLGYVALSFWLPRFLILEHGGELKKTSPALFSCLTHKQNWLSWGVNWVAAVDNNQVLHGDQLQWHSFWFDDKVLSITEIVDGEYIQIKANDAISIELIIEDEEPYSWLQMRVDEDLGTIRINRPFAYWMTSKKQSTLEKTHKKILSTCQN